MHSISAVRTATSFTRVAMVKVVMVILLLVHVTRHHWLPVSASPSDVTVARQQHHQLVGGAGLAQADGGKRWAPTEIRMNEFIHKIRSRFHGESPTGFVRRAARRPTTAGQSQSAAKTAHYCWPIRERRQENTGPPGPEKRPHGRETDQSGCQTLPHENQVWKNSVRAERRRHIATSTH